MNKQVHDNEEMQHCIEDWFDRKKTQGKEDHCNAMLPNTAQYEVRGLLITVKEGWLSYTGALYESQHMGVS